MSYTGKHKIWKVLRNCHLRSIRKSIKKERFRFLLSWYRTNLKVFFFSINRRKKRYLNEMNWSVVTQHWLWLFTHQSPMLQVETKFSIILAFGERWNEKKIHILFWYQDWFHLEVSVHAHINQLVSNTGKSGMSNYSQTLHKNKIIILLQKLLLCKDFYLLPLNSSVENA